MIQVNPDKQITTSDISGSGESLDTTISTINTNISNLSTAVNGKITGLGLANNLTTTAANYALDARQGKALNDKIPTIVSGTLIAGAGINIYAYSLVKYGNIVDIELELNGNTFSEDVSTNVATLPEGFRPSTRRRIGIGPVDSSTGKIIGHFEYFIETNGYINVTTPINGFLTIHDTFICS